MNIKGGMEKAKLYIDTHSKEHNANIKKGAFVTISREPGAGSDLVSEYLVDYFNANDPVKEIEWTIFDRSLIETILTDNNLPENLSTYFNSDHSSSITRMINEMLGLQPSEAKIIHSISETLIRLAHLGRTILVGRASNIITAKLFNGFHVRLVAPLEQRILHIQEHYSFDRKEAIEFISKEELSRADFVKRHFFIDINDPYTYNLIINTGLVTHKEAADIIGNCVINKFPDLFKI